MRQPVALLWARALKLLGVCVVLAGALAGCSLPRMIDSDVQSFASGNAPASPAPYRFERLPSQAADPAQERLETLTAQALEKVGLRLGDSQAPYTAQVQLGIGQIPNPHWPQPSMPGLLRWRALQRDDGLFGIMEPPWVRHSVQLVLRNAATAQVVYETRASFDGPWSDTAQLLPAILQAALSGYPEASGGVRRVVVELPGKTRAAAP